jgi:hypothetical protein
MYQNPYTQMLITAFIIVKAINNTTTSTREEIKVLQYKFWHIHTVLYNQYSSVEETHTMLNYK